MEILKFFFKFVFLLVLNWQ